MKKLLLSAMLIALLPLWGWAEEREYTDETYQVNYVYDTDGNTAAVKGGLGNTVKGSPNAKGDIVILDKFSVDGKEYTVTAIKQSAFVGCTELTSVVIPSTIKSIETDAFMDCYNLTKADLPEGLESLGELAFSDCNLLTTVTIPASVTHIDLQPFFRCRGLKTITVAEGNAHYDSRGNCNAIIDKETGSLISGCSSTVIPDGVTEIAWGAFCSLSEFKKALIPEGVTRIGAYAFERTGIEEMELPESLTEIQWEAFATCFSMTTVTIGKNVSSIMSSAFSRCSALKVVTSMIEEPFEIEESVFNGIPSAAILVVPEASIEKYKSVPVWNKFKKIKAIGAETGEEREYTDPTNNVVYTYWTDETTAMVKAGSQVDWERTGGSPDATGDVVIAEKISVDGKEYTVTEIGDMAFSNNRNIKSITMPNSIETVGRYAFYGCWSLADVKLSDRLTRISEGMFHSSALKNITIPEGVTSIDYGAFQGCLLQSVVIPESVTTIGSEAFRDSQIESIRIPAGVTDIGGLTFSGCPVTTFVVDENNPVYDSRDNCNGLILTSENKLMAGFEATTIPHSVKIIGEGAFWYGKLVQYTIPEGVEKIESTAFFCCFNLQSITLPKTLKEIEDQAFTYCSSLTSIEIPASVSRIGHRCFGQSGLTSFTFPKGIVSVESDMFEYCDNLVQVRIPSSVTSIDRSAFYSCPKLRAVICLVEEPLEIANNVFTLTDGSFTTAKLYVPESSIERYRNAAEWQNFSDIRPYSEELVIGKEYVDPQTGVVYVYDTDETEASVKGGSSSGAASVCSGEVEILDSFTDGGSTFTVTAVEAYAIGGEGLASITIPASIASIANHAFYLAGTINKVTSLNEEPFPISYDTFYWNTYNNGTLYVPVGTYEVYASTEAWNRFDSITETETVGMATATMSEKPISSYSLDGRQTTFGHKGIEIVRQKDGQVKKVFVK